MVENGFKWDEVHEVAEQLEHVESEELIDKLDAYMGYPHLIHMEILFLMRMAIYVMKEISAG